MKKQVQRLSSIVLVLMLLFSVFDIPLIASANVFENNSSASSGVNNITARADYLYNLTWTAQKNVNGWKNRNTFYQGETYHIPYGQPVKSGKYIYWNVSIDDYMAATRDSSSVFYSSRSYNTYNGEDAYSTYYAMDCSAFAGYCWD